MRRAVITTGLAIALALPLAARTAPVVVGDLQPPASHTDITTSERKQTPDPLAAKLVDAGDLIRAKRPLEAIPILDAVIAAEQAAHAAEKATIYSSRSITETLLYSVSGAKEKKAVIVFDATWSLALFMKGFALIDAERRSEGGDYLKQALVLAPLNANYLNEYAEFQKHDNDFTGAMASFQSAADAAQFAPENVKSAEQRRAWRGMAYVLSEQRKFDEAEALYRKCLALDPDDKGATAELGWIAQQRQKLP